MKPSILCVVTLLAASLSASAQTSSCQKSCNKNSEETYTKAKGKERASYVRESITTYNPEKKYVVFRLWNQKNEPSETEQAEFASIKKFLGKKNIEVVDLKFNSPAEVKEAVEKYNVQVESNGDRLVLIGETFNLNTSNGKALFVIEDNKPISVCSGARCQSNLKSFFGLQSFN